MKKIFLSVVKKNDMNSLSIKNYYHWYMNTCFEELCNVIGKFYCCSTMNCAKIIVACLETNSTECVNNM